MLIVMSCFLLFFHIFPECLRDLSRIYFALNTELCKDIPDLNLNFPSLCLAVYNHMFLHKHSTALHSIFTFPFETCTALHSFCIALHSLTFLTWEMHSIFPFQVCYVPFGSIWPLTNQDQTGPNPS
jgi:hypothetical protein